VTKHAGPLGLILMGVMLAVFPVQAQEAKNSFTLEEAVQLALDRNLRVLISKEGIDAAEYRRRAALADFFPRWTGQYSATEYNTPIGIGPIPPALTRRIPTIAHPRKFALTPGSSDSNLSRDAFSLGTTVSQSVYAGGAIWANYRFEQLDVEGQKAFLDVARLDIVLQTRLGFILVLRAQKVLEVAQQQVKQFESQLGVSNAFFEVGIVAKNDVLQAEVRLAQAQQDLVKAETSLGLAKAQFNNLLRREVEAPLELAMGGNEKTPFATPLEEAFRESVMRRPEVRAAQVSIDQAKESVKIARSAYFPTVSVAGNYSRLSEEPLLAGELRNESWSIQALATVTLWDWKKTASRVGESRVKVTQAENTLQQLKESILLEVKQDYLAMVQSERNIEVAAKSIEQAEENLRVTEERYKYQVATQTEVLDAVTLLAQARVNYYNALSDFNAAKATLERAMGRLVAGGPAGSK
jgi:outer membrane protein